MMSRNKGRGLAGQQGKKLKGGGEGVAKKFILITSIFPSVS